MKKDALSSTYSRKSSSLPWRERYLLWRQTPFITCLSSKFNICLHNWMNVRHCGNISPKRSILPFLFASANFCRPVNLCGMPLIVLLLHILLHRVADICKVKIYVCMSIFRPNITLYTYWWHNITLHECNNLASPSLMQNSTYSPLDNLNISASSSKT